MVDLIKRLENKMVAQAIELNFHVNSGVKWNTHNRKYWVDGKWMFSFIVNINSLTFYIRNPFIAINNHAEADIKNSLNYSISRKGEIKIKIDNDDTADAVSAQVKIWTSRYFPNIRNNSSL